MSNLTNTGQRNKKTNSRKSKSKIKLIAVLIVLVIAIVSLYFCIDELPFIGDGGSKQLDENPPKNATPEVTPPKTNDTPKESEERENAREKVYNTTNNTLELIKNFNKEFKTDKNVTLLKNFSQEIDEGYKIMNSNSPNERSDNLTVLIENVSVEYNKTIKLVKEEIERLNETITKLNASNLNLSIEKTQKDSNLTELKNQKNQSEEEKENMTKLLENLETNKEFFNENFPKSLPKAIADYETQRDGFIGKCTPIPLILIGLIIGAIIGGLITYNWKKDMDKWGMYEKIDRIYSLKISGIIILILIIILLVFLFVYPDNVVSYL